MPSRKDYEAIAALIESMRGDYDELTLVVLADGLSEYFRQDNHLFNRARFMEACGL